VTEHTDGSYDQSPQLEVLVETGATGMDEAQVDVTVTVTFTVSGAHSAVSVTVQSFGSHSGQAVVVVV